MIGKNWNIALIVLAAFFLFWSCDHGELGGADRTSTHVSGDDSVFEERMAFFDGAWYSGYPGLGQLDGYLIRRWGDVTEEEKVRIRSVFPGINADNPRTYSSGRTPQDGEFVLLYDDTVFGQQGGGSEGQERWGFSYMGLVRAINIFNDNTGRGAIIIEYFEGSDPKWLWSADNWNNTSQGLAQGEKPFFGIYYRVINQNRVQMANAVNLSAMYAGERYHTETRTLEEAVALNTVENEAEFISWGVVTPQNRER